jgi:hypothetical protein
MESFWDSMGKEFLSQSDSEYSGREKNEILEWLNSIPIADNTISHHSNLIFFYQLNGDPDPPLI